MAVTRARKALKTYGSALRGAGEGLLAGLTTGNPWVAATLGATNAVSRGLQEYNNGEKTFQRIEKEKKQNGLNKISNPMVTTDSVVPDSLYPQSQDPKIKYIGKYTPDQQNTLNYLRKKGLEGIENNPNSFEAVRENALRNFEQNIDPSLRSSLTSYNSKPGDSAWEQARAGARANLESDLAAQQVAYGERQQSLYERLLNQGLGEQFDASRDQYEGDNDETGFNRRNEDLQGGAGYLNNFFNGYMNWRAQQTGKQTQNQQPQVQGNPQSVGAPQGLQALPQNLTPLNKINLSRTGKI